MISVNPASGQTIQSYNAHSDSEIASIIDLVQKDYLSYKESTFSYRSELMYKAADLLEKEAGDLGLLITREMGKPLSESTGEVKKCALVCRYYGEHAERFLASEKPWTADNGPLKITDESYIAFRPLGIILAIMPWNFPFWQVFRFAAPALMAGNAALLKHASNVSGCALAIEDIFRRAGFPENIFRTLLISGEQASKLIHHNDIRAATLTGSGPAGASLASNAGKALKKTVLELGGSDPYIILKDAELGHAAEICAAARLVNAGQSCIAAKRFIIEENVYEEFTHKFSQAMKCFSMGDPENPETKVGPMAREDLQQEVYDQIQASVKKGAHLILGGEKSSPGFYLSPAILGNVEPGMAAFDEEIFGPAAALVKASSEDHAIALANQSNFGLGAAVFTQDYEKGRKIAEEKLDAGFCALNDSVRSHPALPFGGIKESGYGRELSSYGIREFVNIKTVYLKTT